MLLSLKTECLSLYIKNRLKKKHLILLLIILTVSVYANSLFNRYAYDDYEFLVDNPAVHSLKNWPSYFTSSGSTSAFIKFAHYRPLATLNFAAGYSLWGDNPFGFHLLSLIYHLINVILVFLLLTKLLTQDISAFWGAALFAVHPVQTEAVSWISSQGNLLALIFYLTAIIVFLKYLEEQQQSQKTRKPKGELFLEKRPLPLSPPRKNFNWLADKLLNPSMKAIFIISLCFLLAIFTKEMAITLPLILLLINFIYGDKTMRKPRSISLLLVPLIIIAAGYLVVRTAVLQRVAMRGFWGGSPFGTMLTMSVVIFRYLGLLIVPVKQRVLYDLPVFASLSWQPLLAFSGLLAIGTVTFLLFKRNRAAAFGLLFFFITLLPVSNIIPITLLIAERFLYFPILGLIIFGLALLDQFTGKPEDGGGVENIPNQLCFILASIILLFSAATFQRNRAWYDDLTLWTNNLKTSPKLAEVHFNLATALNRYQRYDEAARSYRRALALKPDYSRALENLAYLAPLGGVTEKEAFRLLARAKKMKRAIRK